MKTTTTVARVAGNVRRGDQRTKRGSSVAPITANFQAGSKKPKDTAFGAEHTKPSNSRSVIRATEGKRWTARQQGRG